jgi:hypothetical protein
MEVRSKSFSKKQLQRIAADPSGQLSWTPCWNSP